MEYQPQFDSYTTSEEIAQDIGFSWKLSNFFDFFFCPEFHFLYVQKLDSKSFSILV